jgi:uncharacterized protein (DUF1330 family)
MDRHGARSATRGRDHRPINPSSNQCGGTRFEARDKEGAVQERLSAGMTRRRLLLSGGGGIAGTLFLPELSAFAHAGRAVAELTEHPTQTGEARNMAAYIIGLGRSAPRGTAWAKEYRPKAAALVAKYGGKALIGRNSTPRLLALEGKPPLAVVILEFPSLELAQAWHDDPDYAPLKQLRQANVDMEVFAVET